MRSGIGWFARNRVAANLLMTAFVLSGLLAVGGITGEVFPEIDLDRIDIEVPYLGAAPEEVEQGVVMRIEEAVRDVDGVRQIRATAAEGGGTVSVELELGADARRTIDEIRNNVDAIATFPAGTERPIIREVIARNQVGDVAISGSAGLAALKTLAERVRSELTALPEITQAEIAGAPAYEIAIEVSESALRRHGLTFDGVADAVRQSSVDLPGGSIRTDGGEVLLRSLGQAYRGAQFENLPLWTRPDGTRLRLGDVATIVDGFAESDQHARFDGDPMVMVSVFRTGDQSAFAIAGAMHRYVERARASLPDGVRMTIWQDQAAILQDRLALMLRNGAAGFALVLVVLALFLELRVAFWVSLSIPISFLGAIALMPTLDVSLNAVSLFAFILALGIVVDDAIIVGESIHTRQEEEGDGLQGATAGAGDVAKPVTFAVLTTVAAFVPLLFMPGVIGKGFRDIPLVVIPCLVFSLIESLAILPAHLSDAPRLRRAGRWRRFQQCFAGGLKWFARTCYAPMLDRALQWRYVTAAAGVSTIVLTAGMLLGGRARLSFFPSVEADFISASLSMPLGTPVDLTSEAVERLERGAAELREQLREETGTDHFRHVSATIGDQPIVSRAGGAAGPILDVAAPNVGEVTVELAPPALRAYTSEQLGDMWREATGAIPEASALAFTATMAFAGADVHVRLSGDDLDRLRGATEALEARLRGYAGVYDIADSLGGRDELQLRIKPAAEMLGLTQRDLGRQVRQAFYGEEAQRIQRGRDDIRVMIRYPPQQRRSLGDLANMRIRSPEGAEVPFGHVAHVERGRASSTISRFDRKRTVNVTASVSSGLAGLNGELEREVLPEVLADHPGVSYSMGGAAAQQAETTGGLQRGFLLALFGIFALLAIPLRSYLQPLIIMGAIPFGLVGAVWGHMALGLEVSSMSMLGLVALSGVVVNDSLVMVDCINRKREAHTDPHAAVVEAGSNRFRAILLTSLTTFFGLGPLILERSMQAAFLVPMAVSLAFGVLFATFVTLILVPACYLILHDLQQAAGRIFGRAQPDA